MKRNSTGIEDIPLDGSASDAVEVNLEELREFLMGDLLPDLADPDFKSRLRSQLWKILRERQAKSRETP